MLYIVMGVSGTGKTTVGRKLAGALGCAFLEGDELHPQANIEKMSCGIPLDDEDRAPWLAAIRKRLEQAAAASADLVVACSALKQRYRDTLGHDLPVRWIYLTGDPALLLQRLQQRQGHYMKAGMLASQLADLEPPDPASAVTLDVDQPVSSLVALALAAARPAKP